MEVNPCKKCGRPVSVHAEYCPYCGCVVDRRPFVPASSSKPLGGGSTPAPSAPVARPVAQPKPAAPSPTPAPVAEASAPELQDVERRGAELGVQTEAPVASSGKTTPSKKKTPAAAKDRKADSAASSAARPASTPPVAPPPVSPRRTDEDDEPSRSSGSGMKWALGILALVVAGSAAGGYYYYENYLAAPEPTAQTPIAQPDTLPATAESGVDNEAELREKVINYWDIYTKRSSGLILQYSNAQLRKMLEVKGFVCTTDTTATAADRADVYELTTSKGTVLCRFVINNNRVHNELWFKYPDDKAAFLKAAATAGFKAGTSTEGDDRLPAYYSSFRADSVRTYPNTRHDYIVDGEETLKLYRERER